MKINIKEIINNMKYRNVYLVLAIILAVVMISSGTYAFWTLLFEEDTSIAFTVPDADVECNGDGGAPLGTAGQTTLVPTTCDDSEHAFQREITINTKNNSLLNLSLGLNINHIGEGLSNSHNLRYAITTDPDSCSDGVVASGNFYGMQNGGQLTFFDHMYIDKPGIVDLDLIYYLYVWLDKEETSIETANQYLDVELFGSCYGGATYSEDNPEDNIYIISYDGMGGQNVPASQFKKHDETIEIYSWEPYRDGAQFLGWNTESDYSGTTYMSGDEYSANEAVTLYAIWGTGATAIYSEDDNSLRFYMLDSPVSVGDTYNDLTVTEVWTGFDSAIYNFDSPAPWYDYREEITNVVVEDNISPSNISYWFYEMRNCSNFDVTNLDTSNVSGMNGTFHSAGYNATTFSLNLSSWDTSSVTTMESMFSSAGYKATTWNVYGLNDFDVSNVTDMSYMFYNAGRNLTTFSLDLSSWDTSSVTTMSRMFEEAGYNATTWNVYGLNDFEVSNVTDMSYMFGYAGYNATTFSLDLSDWDTSSVTTTLWMFDNAGYSATTFSLDLSNWDTSSVTNMSWMFSKVGYNATTWNVYGLNDFDVSNVVSMVSMFEEAGYNATTFSLDLSNWDVSNVTLMFNMFQRVGYESSTVSLNLSSWDTSSVTSMMGMFRRVGYESSTVSLNLSSWDTSSVTSMSVMFEGVGLGAISSLNIYGLNDFDVSNVTDMGEMFKSVGKNSKTWNIGDLSGWDTSSVTDMSSMFNGAGLNSTNNWELDLSGWDVSNVTSYSDFKVDTESRIISPWDSPTYTITLLDPVGGNGTNQALVNYNSSAISYTTLDFFPVTLTLGSISGYKRTITAENATILNTNISSSIPKFNGWWTKQSGGLKVMSGTVNLSLLPNVSGYTDANGNWIYKGDVTLYAQWTGGFVLPTVTLSGATCYWTYAGVRYNSGATAIITAENVTLNAWCEYSS